MSKTAEWKQIADHGWRYADTEWTIWWQGELDGYWVDREGESDPRLPRAFKTLNAAKRWAEPLITAKVS